MSSPVWSKWLIVAGVLTAAVGIILYTQLDWVNEVAISLKSFAVTAGVMR